MVEEGLSPLTPKSMLQGSGDSKKPTGCWKLSPGLSQGSAKGEASVQCEREGLSRGSQRGLPSNLCLRVGASWQVRCLGEKGGNKRRRIGIYHLIESVLNQ